RNQALVDRYWPGQSALGKRVGSREKSYTVIGVAQSSSYNDLSEAPQPFVYFPLLQDHSFGAIIHARVSGDPLSFADTIEKTVHQMNADLPVFDVSSLKARVGVAST